MCVYVCIYSLKQHLQTHIPVCSRVIDSALTPPATTHTQTHTHTNTHKHTNTQTHKHTKGDTYTHTEREKMKRERAKERRECVSINPFTSTCVTKKLCTLLLNKKIVHCYSCVHVLLCLLNLDAVYIQIQQILYAEYIHILYAVHIHRIHTLYAMCIGRTNTYNGVQTTPHQRCQYTQSTRKRYALFLQLFVYLFVQLVWTVRFI